MSTQGDDRKAKGARPGSYDPKRPPEQNKKEIWTLSGPNKRTRFQYSGSVESGATIHFLSGDAVISPALFQAILNRFRGQIVAGGFSMTNPTPGGLGEWVRDHSRDINLVSLTPRHASFIAAILVHEGYITHRLKGNAVYLEF
jgi:hypothetical protein